MRRHSALMIAAAVLALHGCGSEVAAPAGLEEPYSLFGVLNPTVDTQTLLVSPIDDLLEPLGETIDAHVTSTDLATGLLHEWQDSVVVNATGQREHIFWSRFRPEFGSRHRIEVMRSDGERSRVVVEVPRQVSVEQIDTGTRYQLVTIEGDETERDEDLRLIRFDITYGVQLYDGRADTLGPVSSYTFSKSGEALRRESGWRVDVDLDADYTLARASYQSEHAEALERVMEAPECAALALLEMRASLTIGNPDWPPSGSNPNVTAYASAATNVENGLGFVAGGYDRELALSPSPEALRDTWFLDLTDGQRPEAVRCDPLAKES